MRSIAWRIAVVTIFVLTMGIWLVLMTQPATAVIRPHLMLLGLLLAIGFLMTLEPLWRLYVRLRNGWGTRFKPDRQGLMEQMIEALAIVRDQHTLQTLLVQRLSNLMAISAVALYLRCGERELELAETAGLEPEASLPMRLAVDGQLPVYLLICQNPVDHAVLLKALSNLELTGHEQSVLLQPWALWLPLRSSGRLQGFLALGPKRGAFTHRDRQTLGILAHQGGITAQAARLTEEVRIRQQELSQANAKLLEAGEKERRWLARELHDGALQELLGISYQLAQVTPVAGPVDREQIANIREEILAVAASLRFQIGELRPAGLEEMGLVSALQSYVGRLERVDHGAAPQIITRLMPEPIELPLPIALGLFRVAQEAISNARKHADARHIWVDLTLTDDTLTLCVGDDGQGFEVPDRLSELAHEGHYGLVSLAERVAQIGGKLEIESMVDGGTQIRVHVAQPQEMQP